MMKKALAVIAALATTGFVWFLYYHGMAHFLGIDTQASENYDFVSGVGPMIITGVGYAGITGTLIRHINCHAAGCPRIGRFPVAGGSFKVCKRHHHEVTGRGHQLTVEVLKKLHREHVSAGE